MTSRAMTAEASTIAAPTPAGIHGASSWPSFKIPHNKKKNAIVTATDKM
jgi:hypothetical protein